MEEAVIKTRSLLRPCLNAALAVVLVAGIAPPARAFAQESLSAGSIEALADSDIAYSAELTFSDEGIVETVAGSGYKITGTTLEIKSAGTYRIAGSCSEGSISVKKGLADVTLVLDGLTLTASETAPLVVKKGSTVTVKLADGTTSTLTDNEDPANETSTDETVAEAFEGAACKVKAGSSVTFTGGGDLAVVANAKNGIKGGSTSALIFDQTGTISVSGNYSGKATQAGALNNGIACDGSIVVNQGTFDIDAAGDGLKSAPDATDATAGTEIDKDSAGTITINGGTFDIDVDGDGVQADTALTISGGTFDVRTYQGSGVWNDTLAAQYSCKGLKASGDRADEAGIEPAIEITGGTFALDTADDAVHSDAYATVTGGTFSIKTGDDGMHADTKLVLGSENASIERDPDVMIGESYEGLEAGTVCMYSGRYYVIASDDGVNAAGGSANGTDPNRFGSNDPFKPGGPQQGGPGRSGVQSEMQTESSGDYNIYIYGGDLFVNCDGDGLDSNGGLYLYGGTQQVFSQSGNGADNSALDADGTVLVQGATVFTAGAKGVDGTAQASWFGSGQKYITSTAGYKANQAVNATIGGAVAYSRVLPKASSYTMYSAPTTSTLALNTAASATACKAGSWSHSWDAGVVTDGVTAYTCTKCGATEKQTGDPIVAASDSSEGSETPGADSSEDNSSEAQPSIDGSTDNSSEAQPSIDGSTDASSESQPSTDGSTDGTSATTPSAEKSADNANITAAKTAISSAKVSAIPDQTYTGKKITYSPVVTIGGVTLSPSIDYELVFGANKNVGTGTVTIKGLGAYTGEKKVTFNIVAKSISSASASTIAKKYFTGSAIKPAPKLKDGSTVLTKGVDYTLSYKNNASVGTASVVITGKGNYTGKKTVTFKIVKRANTLSVSKGSKTLASSSLKSGKRSVKLVTVKKARGVLTYARVAQGSSKYLTVNKKTGKVTVKQGTPKGVYKVKVRVKAAGNAYYYAKTRIVTATVRVR